MTLGNNRVNEGNYKYHVIYLKIHHEIIQNSVKHGKEAKITEKLRNSEPKKGKTGKMAKTVEMSEISTIMWNM